MLRILWAGLFLVLGLCAKEAFASGRNVADVVVEKGWLSAEQVTELLDIKRMTEGGVIA